MKEEINKDNKYYTPDISEFYVGFEYAKKHFIHQTESTIIEWRNTVIEDAYQLSNAIRLLKEPKMDGSQIKVKYLDQEDIESLGFKYIKTQPGLNEDFFECVKVSNKYYLEFDYDTKYLRIYFSLEEGDSTIFAGVIKNKSELKKLLKQIGYYDNTRNS